MRKAIRKNIAVVVFVIIVAATLLKYEIIPDTVESAVESPIKVSETEGVTPGGFIPAKVTRIVDGDTVKAKFDGDEYTVRLLCIDTPETVKNGIDPQPYGKKATEKLKSMVLDKMVILQFENEINDKYGRYLAYIILGDGSCVNATLVEQGYARVDVVRPNTDNRDYFNTLQSQAIEQKRGLWSLPEEERPFILNEKGYYIPRYIDSEAA